MEDNTEYESKVNIEATSINLGCVKKELNEEIFDFEETTLIKEEYRRLIEQDEDNLLSFSGNDVLMESVVVMRDNVKQDTNLKLRNVDYFHCNRCGSNYDGYCSTLSHILNNNTLYIESEAELNTLPTNILEIKTISTEKRVFALKEIPKNVTFGPFEGVSTIKHTNTLLLKIEDNKFVNVENSNWMKCVGCAENDSFKNLDIFQCKDSIYFRSIREIKEGEELLIYYSEKEIQKIDTEEEYYPVKEYTFSKTFACTLCCLGFGLDKCLIEHKSKCPHTKINENIRDLEIVECHLCKIWLVKQEYLDHHLFYCDEFYHKELNNVPNIREEGAIYVNGAILISDDENTDRTPNTVSITSPSVEIEFQCSICADKANNMADFSLHKCEKTVQEVKYEDDMENNAKMYKCLICSFQTDFKRVLTKHVMIHSNSKTFQCYICQTLFDGQFSLKSHMTSNHLKWPEKDYKCEQCDYQTDLKHYFRKHMNRHTNIVYKCDYCKQTFRRKSSLNFHIIDRHQRQGESQYKWYKCPQCIYKTIYEFKFSRHVDTHPEIKRFECHICKNKYNERQNLELHIKTKHVINERINHRCAECSFHTDNVKDFHIHLKTHNDVKLLFRCDICETGYSQKEHLELHITMHSNDKETVI